MVALTGYNKLKVIHEGHRNVVYEAQREDDGLPVVLKMLRSLNPEVHEIALVFHEFEITKDLKLPGVIKTLSLVEEKNRYTLVQENIHGVSLADYVKEHPIEDLNEFYQIALQMVSIVEDIHQNHIIHKDIKPSNFIIDPETKVIKLTDFNFATKLQHESQFVVPPKELEGTLAYMAPEQTGRMNMNIDYRTDFYSLGVAFYEILTGQLPFQFSDPMEIIHAHIATPPPAASKINPEVPEILSEIIQKLMSKNPDMRYQSTQGIEADLKQCFEEGSKAFTLGEKDVNDQLNVSEKIYGRKEELSTLLGIYEKTAKGSVEAVMISGFSGIGKTKLVNEVLKPMTKHKGYFIRGKFDQLERNSPYKVFRQAFNELARVILAEPESQFETIKSRILEALGGVAQVIIDIAPDMELVIGKQPPLESLPPQETQNRLMVYFKRFLRALASQQHPITLFIDDLQWIDEGSLKLIEYILTDEKLGHVFMIGAYRDNEVSAIHPLQQFLDELKERNRPFTHVYLEPLTQTQFCSLLKDSFLFYEGEVETLSNLIYKKSGGNPFFYKLLLTTIYREQLIYFDYTKRVWSWDFKKIEAFKITDNVVELMVSKLNELPEETLNHLKYASCIGNRFDLKTLHLISGGDLESIGNALWPALENELIISRDYGYKKIGAAKHKDLLSSLDKEITYEFIHDKVQQAVYEAVSIEEKEEIHLNIARTLKKAALSSQEHLFEITDHYNRSGDRFSEAERLQVIEYNYQAGVKSQGANAFGSMLNYLTKAFNLSTENDWSDNYELTFDLNLLYAQSLYLNSKREENNQFLDELLEKAKNPIDQARIYNKRSINLQAESKNHEAIDAGIKALKILGVVIPRNPSKLRARIKLYKLKRTLKQSVFRSIFHDLKSVTDPKMEFVFDVLQELTMPAYLTQPDLRAYLQLHAMSLAIQGSKPKGIVSFVMGYLMEVLYLTGDIKYISQLLKSFEEIFGNESEKYSSSMGYLTYGMVLNHLINPVESGVPILKKALNYAIESGNLKVGYYSHEALQDTALACGKSFEEISEREVLTCNFAKDMGMQSRAVSSEFDALQTEMLMGKMPVDEAQIDEFLKNFPDFYLGNKAQLAEGLSYFYFFLDSYAKACDAFFEYVESTKKFFSEVDIFFKITLSGLSLIKQLPKERLVQKVNYLYHINSIIRKIKFAAKACPHNYLHMYLFLLGARSELFHQHKRAIYYYENGIENARKGGFFLWIAIGNELCAELLLSKGSPKQSYEYLRQAHYYYTRVGVMVKVKRLEERFPDLLSGSKLTAPSHEYSKSGSSLSTSSSSLDLNTVIKASQSISGEIVIENLLEKMLRITIENAGAQKGVFLELDKNRWIVTASLVVGEGKETFSIHNAPLQDFKSIPHTVLNSASRSKEPVIIDNPLLDYRYENDPYISEVDPKSILSLPIIHHNDVIALIYLENDLTPGAFTQERVEVLKTLSAQIAISLENARHVDHVEMLYKKTERFVPKPFLQLLDKAHIEDVHLGDSVRKEISVLFNDIRSFTTLVEKYTPEEAFAFINRYWEFMAPVIRANQGYIDQYQGDAILAIFPHSPEDAVRASMQMIMALEQFNKKQQAMNEISIDMGIGLSTGPAMLGVIGEKERHVSGLISDVANTAARTEGLTKVYKTPILFTGQTAGALPENSELKFRKIDSLRLKGKSAVTDIFEVIMWESKLKNVSLDGYLEIFSKGLDHYYRGQFLDAKNTFEDCLRYFPEDGAAQILSKRCDYYIENGTPEGWDGAFTMTSK